MLYVNGEVMSVHALQLPQMNGLRPASQLIPQGFPVDGELSGVLPWPRLRPGAVIGVTSRASAGVTSLVLTLLAGPSKAGAWCAVVGAARLSASAASHAGVKLSHLALVPDSAGRDNQVAGVLMEGMDVVALRLNASVHQKDAVRLAAKARRNGSVLVPFGSESARWPGTDAQLVVSQVRWHGLREGRGLLRHCSLTVSSVVRGQHRHVTLYPYGRPEPETSRVHGRLASVVSLVDRKHMRKGGARSAGSGRAVS